MPPVQTSPRIFLVSFNKCGTGSFFRLFGRSRIAAVHHHLPGDAHAQRNPEASLAMAMFRNFMLARDPLVGIDGYTAYTDLAYYSDTTLFEAGRLYAYLHAHYPDAYFILATREVEAWLRSRMNHGGGSLAARMASILGGATLETVAETWRDQFLAHNAEVRGYFAARPDARFLEFDIDTGEPERIAEFLRADFTLRVDKWARSNVTSATTRARAAERHAAAGE